MILHSFGQDFRPWGEYARTIRSELSRQSRWPLNISDHPLVAARSIDKNPEVPFVEYLNALGAQRQHDLIIAIGAPAADFVQRHRGELFPQTPIILTAVEQRRVRSDDLTANDAVVAVAHDYAAVFENILRLLPDTQTIVIVNGASPNEKFWLGELKRELEPFANRIKLLWYEGMPFEAVLKEAASLAPKSAIFWHLMNVDVAGVAYEGDTGLKRLYAVANAPIFSYDDGFFGREVVGGPMYSVQDISQKTASVAVRILAGERAGDIPVPPTRFAAPKYDWRLLQRWKINESLLPSGSQVWFREASAWERYRSLILLVSAVMLVQAALISGLLYQRRRTQAAELVARQRLTELARVNRVSTVGELTATIAHELKQPLGAILANAETMEAILKSPSPDLNELQEIVSDICRDDRRADDVIERVRALLQKTPFEPKIVDLNDIVVETLELLSGLTVSRQIEIAYSRPPEPLTVKGDPVQLQQVLLNLIVNGVDALSSKRVSERRIKIGTATVDRQAELYVSDNGPGIDSNKLNDVFQTFYSTKPNGMGMGLSIVRTIVEAHNGRITAENQPGGGAVFRLRLPLA